MVVIIGKDNVRKQLVEALKRLKQDRGFNAMKYVGVVKLHDDPLAIQKALRDEWD